MFDFLPTFSDIIITLLTSMVAIAIVAAIGIGSIVAAALLLSPPLRQVARYVGILFIMILGVQIGYRFADDRAADRAALTTERLKSARLQRDLDTQKRVADDAASRRDILTKELAERNKEVGDYEDRLEKALADKEKKPTPGTKQVVVSCVTSDDTKRTVDRLHKSFGRR